MLFDFFTKKKDSPPSEKLQASTINPTQQEISEFANSFETLTGITFDLNKDILKNKLCTLCKNHQIDSIATLQQKLLHDSLLKQEIINYLTTNETYFYRELAQIMQVVSHAKNSTNTISILCAPCSSGEEVYSIIIALLDAGIDHSRIRVVGVDINSQMILHAKKGCYSERSLNYLKEDVRKKFFLQKDGEFCVTQTVLACAEFKVLNIFDETFSHLGEFDFVFSRNMFIYFNQATKIKAKNILESMLKDENSKLFLGHADLF